VPDIYKTVNSSTGVRAEGNLSYNPFCNDEQHNSKVQKNKVVLVC
jgi:hypothetical protein